MAREQRFIRRLTPIFADWEQGCTLCADPPSVGHHSSHVRGDLWQQGRIPILLIGGDKTGDGRLYDKMIPLADRLSDSSMRPDLTPNLDAGPSESAICTMGRYPLTAVASTYAFSFWANRAKLWTRRNRLISHLWAIGSAWVISK